MQCSDPRSCGPRHGPVVPMPSSGPECRDHSLKEKGAWLLVFMDSLGISEAAFKML